MSEDKPPATITCFEDLSVVNFTGDQFTIQSIYAHGDKLVLGLSNGNIQVYVLDDPTSSTLKSKLIATYKNISHRSIDRIVALRDAGIFAVLSDGIISVLDLETFSLAETLQKTKGAVTLATYESAVQLPSGGSVFVSRLVVSCRRRLACYEWRDSEFIEYKEIVLPDIAKSLTITRDGSNVICGLNSEYAFVNIPDATISATVVPGSHQSSHDEAHSSTASSYFSFASRAPDLLSSTLSENSNILVHEVKCQFVDSTGELLVDREVAVTRFPSLPKVIGFSYPYFICITKTGLEIRNPDTLYLLQSIEISNITSVNFGKSFYVATPKQVYRILITPFLLQINQLIATNNYVEAVSMLSQIEPVLVDNKQELLRNLQIKRATQLFFEKKYEDSMALFSDISAPPNAVINLFPSLVPAGTDQSQSDNQDDLAKKPSEQTAEELKKSVRLLLPFLAQTRRKISKLLISHEKVQYHGYELSEEIYGDLDEAAITVDTCLFRCYMLVTPALVGPLVRVHNHCDPAVVTKMLGDRKKWQELIDFYYGKGMHKEALELIKKLADEGDSLLEGPEPTVKYLQKLGNDNLDIVLEYSEWPLKEDSLKYGTELFLEDSSESLSLDRQKVLKYISSDPDWISLTIKYLEYVIYELKDDTTTFHNNLALHYIRNVDNYGAQLLKFLSEEPYYYRPDRLLNELRNKIEKSATLIEAEAILHGKKGEHEQALKVYVFKLNNQKQARAYCSALYDKDPDTGKEILNTLLSLYLMETLGEANSSILDLLASQGSRMSVLNVISSLPDTTKIQDVEKFLQSHMRLLTSTLNEDLVESALLKVDLVRVQQQLLQLGQRYTSITQYKTCQYCLKRLGQSVISTFPDGTVTHYGCSKVYRERLDKENKSRRQIRAEAVKDSAWLQSL